MSGDETERPIEVHAKGSAYAIAHLSAEEYQRLEDGESFWSVVEDVPEFAPASTSGEWDWSRQSRGDRSDG